MRAALSILALAAAALGQTGEPRLRAALAAPSLLAVTFDHGVFIRDGLKPYESQSGDSIVYHAASHERRLFRAGRHVGGITGRAGGPLFVRFWDQLDKSWLDMSLGWDQPGRFRIRSSDDDAYGAGLNPTGVYRKSKPLEVRRIGANSYGSVDRHVLYLALPAPLRPGAAYRIEFPNDLAPFEFTFDPRTQVTESLHVNHLGFRPDDPSKLGFLSLWAGTGGPFRFEDEPAFEVIDAESGESVFSGKGTRAKPADDPGEDAYKIDHTLAPVWLLDFTPLNREGRYRLSLPGVGVSGEFVIGRDETWRKALRSVARGFFHQRSGMAFEEPFTDYTRPRPYHPEDGLQVFLSRTPYVSFDSKLNAQDRIFERLVANVTDETVPNAWGGYFDAGDWDRNIQHLRAARAMLRLWEFAPRPLADLSWNIPKANPALPDLLEEALWGVEFFARLQTSEGGVRGGIEAEEHPVFPDTSWLESLKVMTFEPDIFSSWSYAASAAQAARIVRPFDEARAAGLDQSARRAFDWAEAQFASYSGEPLEHRFRDARNLAAVELWRLTTEPRYLQVFLDTTAFTADNTELDVWQKHDQAEAAVSYLLAADLERDEALVRNALAAVRNSAGVRLAQSRRAAFRWTKNPWAPTGWGILGSTQAEYLVYAHRFTGDEKYLAAAIDASQQALGANPMNRTYTTRLGREWPTIPLIIDPEVTAHPHPPEGIVVYGPAAGQRAWSLNLWGKWCVPAWTEWPIVESYVNLGLLDPGTNEYTIQQTNTPALFVWGYLAARPEFAVVESVPAAAAQGNHTPGKHIH